MDVDDKVKLKINPEMEVKSVSGDMRTCVWTDGNERTHQLSVDANQLEKVERPEWRLVVYGEQDDDRGWQDV